ncbi:unnamed protein product [Plutella xylostella]|uniref:(diamondback moth) hypothetical protein n=1 Tax=Plutella xylostella TaxID=51655 RepID=A0A8S4GBC2_PLUXY|nr:unnamed protein product [Plutella xylostella]
MFQTEIETMSEDFDDESDESLRERQLFEIQYYGAVSAARQLLQPVSSVSTSTSSCAGSGSKPSIVKLPQISLPHFNAVVRVLDSEGNRHIARVLLDNGSTANFISQSLCDQLGLRLRPQ